MRPWKWEKDGNSASQTSWATKTSKYFRDPTWIQIVLYILHLASVDARASYKSRTIETGNSFLEGLGFEQSTYVDNEKSIYYKDEFGCARYDQEVGACKLLDIFNLPYSLQVRDNDNVTEAEAIRFTESQVWTDMLEGVSKRTGVQVRLLQKLTSSFTQLWSVR